MSHQTKLWAIHIPGPDEHHPAPSEAIARHMAQKHNAAMESYLAKNPDTSGFFPPRESILAKVVEWPFEPGCHVEQVQEFDYTAWGLEPHGPVPPVVLWTAADDTEGGDA